MSAANGPTSSAKFLICASTRGEEHLGHWPIPELDRYAGGRGGADAAHWLSMHNGESIVVDHKTGNPRTLDTHVVFWWLDDPSQLSPQARTKIGDTRNEVFVSAVVAWEIAIKRALGKLTTPMGFEAAIGSSGFQSLPITIPQALLTESLPAHHSDPFDRLLVAQAIAKGCTVISRDADIPGFAEEGTRAKLTVTDRWIAGGTYLATDGVYEIDGKTAEAFHVVTGPDSLGGIRTTVFRADGIQYGGQVFIDGNKQIVKLKGKTRPLDEESQKPDGDKPITFSADLIFEHPDHDTTLVRVKNLVVGGNAVPEADVEPERAKRVR